LAHAAESLHRRPRSGSVAAGQGAFPPERVMKSGITFPDSCDVAGGVQQHIKDLAEALIDEGHGVSVISPADDDTPLPPYVTGAGRAVPVPYNGRGARLSFGFLSVSR